MAEGGTLDVLVWYWSGKELKDAIRSLFVEFIKPSNILPEFQMIVHMDQKDIEEVKAETNKSGDMIGAELLLNKLTKQKADWFSLLINVLCDQEVKLQHVARMMEEEKKNFEYQQSHSSTALRNGFKINKDVLVLPSSSSLYIKYTRAVKRDMLPIFRKNYITPEDMLPVFHKLGERVLTRNDEENIKAAVGRAGNIEGATMLLDRLILYEDWYEVLLKVLEELNLHHVKEKIRDITSETRKSYMAELEECQHNLKLFGHETQWTPKQMIYEDCPDEITVDYDQRRGSDLTVCADDDELESDSAEMRIDQLSSHFQGLAEDAPSSHQNNTSQLASTRSPTASVSVTDVALPTDKDEALMKAAKDGSIELLRSLILKRLNVNYQDSSGTTPLMICASKNHSKCLELLIRAGAQVNMTDKSGMTTLMFAAKKGSTCCLKFLLDRSLIDKSDNRERTALIHAAHNGRNDCVKLLLDAGCDVNKQDCSGNTALMMSTDIGHFECVDLLCARAELDIGNAEGVTALMIAANKGNLGCLKLLLENRCDPNSCRVDGRTALMYAAYQGHDECVKLLNDSRCDVNMSNDIGMTALMYAVKSGHTNCVQLLIDAKSDVNKHDKDGSTAVMIAVLFNQSECLKLLIKSCATLNITNNYGYTPLKVAREKGYRDCVALLEAAARHSRNGHTGR